MSLPNDTGCDRRFHTEAQRWRDRIIVAALRDGVPRVQVAAALGLSVATTWVAQSRVAIGDSRAVPRKIAPKGSIGRDPAILALLAAARRKVPTPANVGTASGAPDAPGDAE